VATYFWTPGSANPPGTKPYSIVKANTTTKYLYPLSKIPGLSVGNHLKVQALEMVLPFDENNMNPTRADKLEWSNEITYQKDVVPIEYWVLGGVVTFGIVGVVGLYLYKRRKK